MSISHVEEIDLLILSKVNISDLPNIFLLDRYTYNLCQSPYFWHHICEYHYPWACSHKDKKKEWRDYVIQLHSSLKYQVKTSTFPLDIADSSYIYAAKYGHDDLLRALRFYMGKIMLRCGQYAAENGHLNIIKTIYESEDAKFIDSKYDLMIAELGLDRRHLPIFCWIYKKGLKTENGIKLIGIRHWLYKCGYNSVDLSRLWLESGTMEDFEWITMNLRSLPISSSWASRAVLSNRLDVVKYIASFGVYPDQSSIKCAYRTGMTDVIDWYESLFPRIQ